MTREQFWRHIEETRAGDAEQMQLIETRLAALPAAETADFERHLWQLLADSYTWELWRAAYLINGGCSDDGFDYFRGWLIAQGRETFERALANPDSLAQLPGLEEDSELEEIWSVANGVYEEKTGQAIPKDVYESVQRRELGEGWDFDEEEEMQTRYPELYEKFCAG